MSVFRKILFPFSIVYDGVTFIRNKLFDFGFLKSTRFDIPTIVVGNLSVGGTGKTPQIEYLIRLFCEDYKLAVLSRGYKRKTTGFLLANEETTVQEIGDEPFQFWSKFKDVYVAVDENRVEGIEQLKKLQASPDIVLLDDAFQHRKVNAKVNVLLTSYNDLFVDDLVLPAGNLREGRRGAKRASAIIVTKCPVDLSSVSQDEIQEKLKLKKDQQLFFTTVKYTDNLKGGSGDLWLNELQNYKIVLVTGIANPTPLVSYLEGLNIEVIHLEYGDHHDFSIEEITDIKAKFEKVPTKNKVLLTTEKDFMRLKSKLEIRYIQIETAFLKDGEKFDNLIKSYVE